MIAKWHKSPVLVSFDAEEVHIGDIPFPSVTICNLNKVRKSKWEDINAELVSDPTNNDLIAEKDIAEQGFYPCCWKIQKAIANSRCLAMENGKTLQLHNDIHNRTDLRGLRDRGRHRK